MMSDIMSPSEAGVNIVQLISILNYYFVTENVLHIGCKRLICESCRRNRKVYLHWKLVRHT